ncbi:MAG: metallophosphoesterase family protein, partial [Planctomycetota bacterium]
MKIGVVSDTHGHVELTRPAVRMLREFGVELVLHCGDIGSGDVVRQFAGLPTHFVFGNCDYDRAQLRDAIEAEGQTCHEEFGEIEVGEVS